MAVAGYLRSEPLGVHTAVMTTGPGEVVLDTNVFVAAGFNPGSHSARLVEAVRDGRLRMLWDDATHAEIEHVMRQIPRLSWTRIADLFRSEDRFGGSTHPETFGVCARSSRPQARRRRPGAAGHLGCRFVERGRPDGGLTRVLGHRTIRVVFVRMPWQVARTRDSTQ